MRAFQNCLAYKNIVNVTVLNISGDFQNDISRDIPAVNQNHSIILIQHSTQMHQKDAAEDALDDATEDAPNCAAKDA